MAHRTTLLAVWTALAILWAPFRCSAKPVDFTTFFEESFPHADSNTNPLDMDTYPIANWASHTTATVASHEPNATPSVFYSPWQVVGKRITGTLNGLQDDDPMGIVLGFQPGNATLGDSSVPSASYLLLDWKRVTQTTNFFDFEVAGFTPFHKLTGIATSTQGLVLSKVSGLPTADELWGRVDLSQNSQGGVTELVRGATLGTLGYAANTEYTLSVEFTSTHVVIDINGVPQFQFDGQFSDGRFGLYSCAQGTASGPQFSNFKVDGLGSGDFDGDGVVDGNDFLLWQSQLGLEGVHASDTDGNGAVDGLDFGFWSSSYVINPQAMADGEGVPEPNSVDLLWIAGISLLLSQRAFRVPKSRRSSY
jgi:hypothetical protein